MRINVTQIVWRHWSGKSPILKLEYLMYIIDKFLLRGEILAMQISTVNDEGVANVAAVVVVVAVVV